MLIRLCNARKAGNMKWAIPKILRSIDFEFGQEMVRGRLYLQNPPKRFFGHTPSTKSFFKQVISGTGVYGVFMVGG